MGGRLNIAVYVLVAVLCVPLALDLIRGEQIKKLKGAIESAEMPQFSWDALMSGEYTDGVDEFLKTNFSLRGLAIRSRNQIDYTVFGLTHARSVEMGKEGFLFEKNYIKAALGLDSLEVEDVEAKVANFEALAAESGTPIIVALAPGKASYYPEYLPEGYVQEDESRWNRSYKVWRKLVEESELTLVDLWGEFKDVEGAFPKNGIHWCEWVQVDAYNILRDSIATATGMNPAGLVIDSTYYSTEMEGTDQDIESGLNLWQDLEDLETKYYKSRWADSEVLDRPKVLVVGDSYAWGIVNRGVLKHSFNEGEFWYYNNVVHGPAYLGTGNFGKKPGELHDIATREGLIKTLSGFDAVVLLSTDANLYKFPFKFGE